MNPIECSHDLAFVAVHTFYHNQIEHIFTRMNDNGVGLSWVYPVMILQFATRANPILHATYE